MERASIILILSLFIVSYAYASEITTDNVIKYANEARQERGVAGLAESEKLMDVAEAKLADMIKNKYFAHTSPAGVSPWYWFEKLKYNYHYAGENLAISFMTAEAQQKAWMESATHRKNILNPKYQEIGVAIGAGEINGETSIITVQEFGTLAGAAEAANNSKNFSSVKNENLVKEGVGLKPQVLSDKRTNPISNPTFKDRAYQIIQGMSYIIYMVSVMLIPIAFLSVAIDKILFLINKRNVIAAQKI
jgi:hypothetical protein